MVTSLGIIMTTIAEDLEDFASYPGLVDNNIELVGWVLMVTGFSFVVYSRLNIVIHNPQVKRIILPVLLFFLFITYALLYIFIYIVSYLPPPKLSTAAYQAGEKLRVLVPIEELIIGGLYIYFFMFYLRDSSNEDHQEARKTMKLLVVAQLVQVLGDASLLVLTYASLFLVKRIIITLLYALKLECEFYVLNNLILFQRRRERCLNNFKVDVRSEAVDTQYTALPDSRVNVRHGMDLEKRIPDSCTMHTSPSSMLPVSYGGDEEIRLQQMNSIDELERRHLGRRDNSLSC